MHYDGNGMASVTLDTRKINPNGRFTVKVYENGVLTAKKYNSYGNNYFFDKSNRSIEDGINLSVTNSTNQSSFIAYGWAFASANTYTAKLIFTN